MLTLEAPAKINLTVEVLGKRPDGYHEIRSVIQAIDLCDILRLAPAGDIRFKCDMPGWSAEQSLVSKAAHLVKAEAGYAGGALIELEKRIPLMAGLGGDSSDAAAVLRGLNELWGLKLSGEKMREFAGKLGSDIFFFLQGGTALVSGRGDLVTPLPPLPRRRVIVVNPAVVRQAGKTAQVYASLQPSHYTDGHFTERLAAVLRSGDTFTPELLFNTFENVVFARGAETTTYKSHIRKIGAKNIHLAGTGPAMFILLEDEAQADDLLVRLQNQGMEAYLTQTRVHL